MLGNSQCSMSSVEKCFLRNHTDRQCNKSQHIEKADVSNAEIFLSVGNFYGNHASFKKKIIMYIHVVYIKRNNH